MPYQINFFEDAAPAESTFKTAAIRLNKRLNDKLNATLNEAVGGVVREYADRLDFDGIRYILSQRVIAKGGAEGAPTVDFFGGKNPIEESFKAAAAEFNQRVNDKLRAANNQEIGYMICECADKRDFDGIRYLLSKYPEQINARDGENDTPFIIAVNQGSEKITEFLLAQPNLDINAVGLEGMTAIMWACEHNYTDIGRMLFERPDLDITAKDEDGDTALILAVQSENSELVRLILEREGADVEDKDEEGGSARLIAESFKGDTLDQKEILELIKSHKSYKAEPEPKAKKTAAKTAKTEAAPAPADQQASSRNLDDIKSSALRKLAEKYPYPHSVAFIKWADENQQGVKLRGKSKYQAFISNSEALYGDSGTRDNYDDKALSICKEIGYDPSVDYPLASVEPGADQKPPEATP
jgi:ankyrin repeat protein